MFSSFLVGCSSPSQNSEPSNSYTVTWEKWNGSVLETDTNVAYGSIPSYDGEITKREINNGDGTITKYDFIGWDKKITTVEGDATYTAQFELSPATYYEVKFVDYDDTILYTTSTFGGGQVTYGGPTLTRPHQSLPQTATLL